MFDSLVRVARSRNRRLTRRASREHAGDRAASSQRAAAQPPRARSGGRSSLSLPSLELFQTRRRRTKQRRLGQRHSASPSSADGVEAVEAGVAAGAMRRRSRPKAVLLRSARPRRRRLRLSLAQNGLRHSAEQLRRRAPSSRRLRRQHRQSLYNQPGCPRILRFRRRLDPWRRFWAGSRLGRYVAIWVAQRRP